MGWAFKTSWSALLPLVAAVRNPTVRLRYLAARGVLTEYRLSPMYPDLLNLLGCLDLTPVARPVAIDGTREQIGQSNHREVVFWLVATYARCHKILAKDAPDLERERSPAFDAMLGDLGLQSPADLASRAEAVIAFLPTLWEATEAILAIKPRL
jgi:hypothetical protein